MAAEAGMLKILHVDDDKVNLLVLDQLLSMLGHAPTGVGTAMEALDLLDHEAFDLVLTDIHMPELTGVDLLQTCRRRLGRQAPPMVAVTADVMSRCGDDYRELGFAGVIAKPLMADALTRMLAAASQPAAERTFASAGLTKTARQGDCEPVRVRG
jgi:CheY-like chemotaxis protein